MKQKLLNSTLYVFDVNPYTITEDASEATVIKVQEESYKGFVKMNPDLAAKIVRFNYHVICVNTPEWAPYVDEEDPQEPLTFGIYGSAAEANVSQVVLKRQGGVVTQWTAGDNIFFPFQTECLEDDVVEVHLIEGVDPANLNITGNEYIHWGWVGEDPRTYTGLVTMSSSISIGIENAEPSTHKVVVTSDVAIPEIMEQTPDHQTVVEDYTSPSFPLTMTVNDGNILAFNFGNQASYADFDINPVGFFLGNWQDPDTGDNIAWTDHITNDVNVTIATPQPQTYTITLDAENLSDQNIEVKLNDNQVALTGEYVCQNDDTLTFWPLANSSDYIASNMDGFDDTPGQEHWWKTVNSSETIVLTYLGAGVNFNASWSSNENVSQINIGNTSVTGSQLTDDSWAETVRLHPGQSQIKYFVSTGLPTDMTKFKVDFDYGSGLEPHFAYKQTDSDTGEPFYTDAGDASGATITNPGTWTYNNTPDTGLPWIAFTLPSTDANGNAFVDNTEIIIGSDVSGS